MAIKPILKYPNPVLTTPCKKAGIGKSTKQIIQNLKDSLDNAKPIGAGLAAPQIGVSSQVFIARKFLKDPNQELLRNNAENEMHEDFVFINPKIISFSEQKEIDWEGCLSIPNTYGKIERSKKVKIKAQNEKGERIQITASGLFGRIIQHEMDHLNGILFTSKVIGELVSDKEPACAGKLDKQG